MVSDREPLLSSVSMAENCVAPRELIDRLAELIVEIEPSASNRFGLTERERRVLQLIANGYANVDIAKALECSPHTVKNIIYDLMGRLQLRNRTHAAAFAVRTGLV